MLYESPTQNKINREAKAAQHSRDDRPQYDMASDLAAKKAASNQIHVYLGLYQDTVCKTSRSIELGLVCVCVCVWVINHCVVIVVVATAIVCCYCYCC